MVYPTGELNGETLTLKRGGRIKKIVLNNFSFVIDKNRGVNFLVTISESSFSTFKCILSIGQYANLLNLKSEKKIEENNRRKDEEMNKRIEEMEKNAEEMNKKNAKKIEELQKQIEKPVSLIQQNSINFFGKSASSLKQSDLENIVVEGKISCSPYFVKIAHNYSCLQKLKNNDFPACDGANDEGKKNDAKYEIENCVNSSFAIVKNAVKSFCGVKSIDFCDIETELESILKSAGKYVVSVIQKSFVESDESKKEDEEEVVMDIDDSEPTDTENAEHSEDFSKLNDTELRKLCTKRRLSAKGNRNILIKRLNSDKKKIPKSIEEFYGIDSGYFASWKYKCMEMEQITKRIFEEIFAIGNSFLAQNENTVNAIIAAHLNKTFDKSLNNCGIRYNNNQGESIGNAQNNPVTPDILITTAKNKTNIVVEIKYGTKNSNDAKYQNAGYVISIADDYRKNSKNQSCIPMLSLIVNVRKDKIAKPDNDNSIGNLSLYGYVPCKNLTTKNMKYIECILLKNEKFTSKNFANILLAICSVNQLPEAAPISSHNACVHGDKVFKCYDNPNSARSFAYTGYLPGAKMLCKDTVLVYDKIEGTHHPQNLNQVLHILKQLCNLWGKNLCHGDIRLANIIFGDNSHLIDYDFCGEDDVATYPDGFNTEITDTIRHKDAAAYNVLKKEHDWFSMQAILRWYKCSDKNLWPYLLDQGTRWENIIELLTSGNVGDKWSKFILTPTNDNPTIRSTKSVHTDSPPKQSKNAQKKQTSSSNSSKQNEPLDRSGNASQVKPLPPKQETQKATSTPVRSVKAPGKGTKETRNSSAQASPKGSPSRRNALLAEQPTENITSVLVKRRRQSWKKDPLPKKRKVI